MLDRYNFIDIFSRSIHLQNKIRLSDGREIQDIRINKIVIPIIQRDYAQGRSNSTIKRVRENFLSALYDAVTGKPITLDFIYGDWDNGILIPLDGQQRLTTLFLLHWYAARRENIPAHKLGFLQDFSYETRPDARDFCAELIKFQPKFDKKFLSSEIEDQTWFPLSWKKDPTISAMLKMLDAIDKKFSNVKNFWRALENDAITFYFMPINDMGLTDEIYITMNSRGKLLTEFEHFKAEFKQRLGKIDSRLSEEIIRKIDGDWTDLLWQYRDDKNLVDDGFLKYFRFLCDVLLYKAGKTTQGRERDAFSLLDEFFTGDVRAKISFMAEAFDCWRGLDVDKFFDERVLRGSRVKRNVNQHQRGKIITYFDDNNFFKDCVKAEKFSLGQTVMLYAFVVYLTNREKIKDADFRRRLRIVNNLVSNSGESELSNSENRSNGNRIPAMLEQVDSIMIRGEILTGEQIQTANRFNFNENQLAEEREKLRWTAENPAQAEELFALEDHYLLCGQIGIVVQQKPWNFEPKYARRFISLFNCDYDLINCALLALSKSSEYYFQVNSSGKLYQLGAEKPKSWQNLFHRSQLTKNFDKTRRFLLELLDRRENFTNEYLKSLAADYLAFCEEISVFDWTYYYLKYNIFRPKSYGKYLWEDFAGAPYKFTVLCTEQYRSPNSYQPFLKAVDDKNKISRDYLGMRLDFGARYVECENSAYVVKDTATNLEIERLEIKQDADGFDTEDRIEKFKRSGLL